MLPIQKVFHLLGGQTKLANHFGVTPWAVSKWQTAGVPVQRCIEIEKLTNGEVTCEQLRPDIDWSVLRQSAK